MKPLKHLKRFRVIKDLSGTYCLQSRRTFPFYFMWRTHAFAAQPGRIHQVCENLNRYA